jgi:hypothetical protein
MFSGDTKQFTRLHLVAIKNPGIVDEDDRRA